MARHRFGAESTRRATSDPDIGELSGTVRRGAAISAFTLVIVQIVSFAQTLVLARLLSPEEIGLFAAGTVMSGFLIGFSEGGLRGALIQRKERVGDAADTVFWATAGTGLLLAGLSLLISPLVGDLFQNDVAGVIAAVSSGTLLMHALTNVPDGLMQRRFNFKRRLIIDPSRVLAYAIVSITLAATGYGVWALVIANYAGLTVWLVGTWILARWRPGIGKPSYRLWREMARFAGPILAESMVEKIRTASETALVGRTLQADTLGQYRYGQRLSLIPALAIVQIGSYVLFPAFSRLADKPERFNRAFVKALQMIWVAAIPIAGLTIALGEPGVVLLLGEEWRGAGLAVMAMSGYGVGVALQAAGSEVIKASGRSSLLNYTTVTSLVLGIGLLAALLPLGLLGVGLAISITEVSVGIVVLVLVRRIVPFPVGKMAWLLVPPTLAAGVAMVAIGALDRLVVRPDTQGTFLGIVLLLVEVLAFFVVYLVVLGLIAPSLRRTVVEAVQARLAKRRAGAADDDSDDEPFDMDVATTWFRLPDDLDATMQMPAVAVRRRPPPPRVPPGAPVRAPLPGAPLPGRPPLPGPGRPQPQPPGRPPVPGPGRPPMPVPVHRPPSEVAPRRPIPPQGPPPLPPAPGRRPPPGPGPGPRHPDRMPPPPGYRTPAPPGPARSGSGVLGNGVSGNAVSGNAVSGNGSGASGYAVRGNGSGVPRNGVPGNGSSAPGGGLRGIGNGVSGNGSGVSGNGVSGNGVSGNGVSGNGVSGNGVSGNGVSGNGVSGNGVPGNGVPGNGVPGDGTAGHGGAGNGRPADGGPVQGRHRSDSSGNGIPVNASPGNGSAGHGRQENGRHENERQENGRQENGRQGVGPRPGPAHPEQVGADDPEVRRPRPGPRPSPAPRPRPDPTERRASVDEPTVARGQAARPPRADRADEQPADQGPPSLGRR